MEEINSSAINRYSIYGSVILCITYLLAPVLFYIVLTKSSTIGTFKWIILNHSFWSLFQGTLMGVFKPVFFLPHVAGYGIGVFRNSTYKSTIIWLFLFIISTIMCILGLYLAIIFKYLFIFPSKWTNILQKRKWFIFIACFHIISILIVFIVLLPALRITKEEINEIVATNNPKLLIYLSEPTFIYLPSDTHMAADIFTVISIIFIYICYGVSIIILVYQLKFKKNILKSRLKKSILISSIVEIVLTCVMSIFPYFYLFISLTFNVEGMATTMLIFSQILMTHCLVHFCTTLYFVRPYRDFISKTVSSTLFCKTVRQESNTVRDVIINSSRNHDKL